MHFSSSESASQLRSMRCGEPSLKLVKFEGFWLDPCARGWARTICKNQDMGFTNLQSRRSKLGPSPFLSDASTRSATHSTEVNSMRTFLAPSSRDRGSLRKSLVAVVFALGAVAGAMPSAQAATQVLCYRSGENFYCARPGQPTWCFPSSGSYFCPTPQGTVWCYPNGTSYFCNSNVVLGEIWWLI